MNFSPSDFPDINVSAVSSDNFKTSVVVGGGPIGLMCALTLKKFVPNSTVLVLEARNDDRLTDPTDRAQALSLLSETMGIIGQLCPPGAGKTFVECATDRGSILTVHNLEIVLREWCKYKNIEIKTNTLLKWVCRHPFLRKLFYYVIKRNQYLLTF
jgi:hypothetical protein